MPSSADHTGHVKGDPDSTIQFDVKRTDRGKKVRAFTALNVNYTCSSGEPPGRTGGLRFEHAMGVRHREFEGRGDWQVMALDPKGSVAGKLRRSGVAVGAFRINGELAGPGSSCHTGLLEWRATRQPPPTN